PIIFLNYVEKILEAIIIKRIALIVEEYKLLLKGQIRNKKRKSIKLAIRIIIEIVYIT
ncbi:hypothetical protein B0H65DRAFT_425601, partial [Neurospora tetraspora]